MKAQSISIDKMKNLIHSAISQPYTSLEQYINYFFTLIYKNPQAGMCHTNSALLYSFLNHLKYDVVWRVGYFETFTDFPNYCHSYNKKPNNIVWHSWIEVDDLIIDLTIMRQLNHSGFPVICLNKVLHPNLDLVNFGIFDKNGNIIAKYHQTYPDSFLTEVEENIPSLVLYSYSPLKQINNKDMPLNWEQEFNQTLNQQTGCALNTGWSNLYNKCIFKRNYISRYSLLVSQYSTPITPVYKAFAYLEKKYKNSRINKIVIISPNIFFLPYKMQSSLCNDVKIIPTNNVSSILKNNQCTKPYDNVAYIVFKASGDQESFLFALEDKPTTRIIVDIHQSTFLDWGKESITIS